MSDIYGVLGAGMQGVAAAYDLAKYGKAKEVHLADVCLETAETQAKRLNDLLETAVVKPHCVNVSNAEQLISFLNPLDGVLSAVPYFLNVKVTEAAIETKTNMVDLGGNTDVVFDQHRLTEKALKAGITVIPDCGLMPGLGNVFASYALETMDEVTDVEIRCGGLPQTPRPPLNYKLVFSIGGLTNEYFGRAHILKNGKREEIDTFAELESIEFKDPIGKCEAFTTSGGTSTSPWSFEGKIKNYNYKTVRYPGHYEKFKAVLDLGLLETDPVKVGNVEVSPRDLFHEVVKPRISFPDDKDLVVLRATCRGTKAGQPHTLVLETIDYFDEKTGFSAMERTTAFSAALVLEMITENELERGVCRLEQSIPPMEYLTELKKHSIPISLTS